jgi:prepilin signal peptidase PulO-like enzyme (type II secretory pathway)
MRRNEVDWKKIVLVCVIILAVIALFKFLFWISLEAAAIGVIWILINLFSGDHDYSWIPISLVVGGVVLGFIAYQIGYGFEKSEIGKPIVEGAKAIVQTDNTINEVKQNVSNQFIDTAIQATKDVRK